MVSPLWRLIDTGPLDGPTNMAIDEALLHCFDPQRSAPVLRLYGWAPPCLSLGRFQQAGEVLDRAHCSAAGVGVVRRITGGGVIYHTSELTYAIVCAPRHIPAVSSIKESFRVLTRFLLRFYRKLGLSACYAVESPSAGMRLGERTAFCFSGRESYDILIDNRKIGGNAQRRQKNAIFQHGSIPIVDFAAEGARFLAVPPSEISDAVVALASLGIEQPAEELKALLVEAFEEALPAVLAAETLTEEEREAASLFVKQHQAEFQTWRNGAGMGGVQ